MWIVTREVNAYDQEGEYFIAAYDHKPTFQELKLLLPHKKDSVVGKLTRGGGREDSEYEWYYLFEIESGVRYE